MFEEREKIDSFEGKNRFLSNFYASPIEVNGKSYATVEHAFAAFKTASREQHEEIRLASTPGIAKRLGRKVTLIPDWEEKKIPLMRKLLQLKFQDKELREKLLATGDVLLIEGNTWGDVFWGVCDGKGANNLGILLMEIRNEIR